MATGRVPVHIFDFHLFARESNVNRSMYMSTRGRGGHSGFPENGRSFPTITQKRGQVGSLATTSLTTLMAPLGPAKNEYPISAQSGRANDTPEPRRMRVFQSWRVLRAQRLGNNVTDLSCTDASPRQRLTRPPRTVQRQCQRFLHLDRHLLSVFQSQQAQSSRHLR